MSVSGLCSEVGDLEDEEEYKVNRTISKNRR